MDLDSTSSERKVKIAYLFTTFPRISETFLQREVRIMAEQGIDLGLYTLWGGQRGWEGRDVYRLMHYEMLKLLWRLPKWILLKPDVIYEAFRRLYVRDIACTLNLLETVRGYAFAIVKAHHFKRQAPDLIHCTWATMPATAGWLISRLTGIPFSMGAHAYDVHKCGGDRLLRVKCREARLIHTTTESCRQRLIEVGTAPEKIALIRRGMDVFPEMKPMRWPREVLRIIAVGRMVPKKGYPQLLRILAHCKGAGLDFEALLLGDGPLMAQLTGLRDDLGLRGIVDLPGSARFDEVARAYHWADVLLFTGVVAPDGDRDGLPNVIPEAFSWGLNVITSDVAGTTEAVSNGHNGIVCSVDQPEPWLAALRRLQFDRDFVSSSRRFGRAWVEANYDNRANARDLADFLKKAAGSDRTAQP